MQLIKTLQKADVDFTIYWYCKDDDDEVSFLGEMMDGALKVEFNFVSI